jgi:hypothetical protein
MSAARKYSGDYELQDGKGRKTVAVYRGDYWRCVLADEEYHTALRKMLALLAGISLLYIAMGVLPTGAIGSSGAAAPYVLLPFIALLLPIGMSWGKTVLLSRARRELERREYDQWVVRLHGYSTAMLACAAGTGAGGLLYTFLHWGAEHAVQDALFTLAACIICGLCIWFVHIQDRYRWEKLDK